MNSRSKKKASTATLASKEARGQRLLELRNLTGRTPGKPLTRAILERKYALSARTLKNWEYGHGSGLTEEGAKRMIGIYQKEHINCSITWLLEGIGSPPEPRHHKSYQPKSQIKISDSLSTIDAEQAYFKSLHAEAVTFEIKDDAMAPFYQPNDIVGGIRHYAHDIHYLVDCDCIIETKDGETWLRRLQLSTIPDRYNLYACNISTKIERPTLYAVDILTAAPVMRIWRGKKWLPHH